MFAVSWRRHADSRRNVPCYQRSNLTRIHPPIIVCSQKQINTEHFNLNCNIFDPLQGLIHRRLRIFFNFWWRNEVTGGKGGSYEGQVVFLTARKQPGGSRRMRWPWEEHSLTTNNQKRERTGRPPGLLSPAPLEQLTVHSSLVCVRAPESEGASLWWREMSDSNNNSSIVIDPFCCGPSGGRRTEKEMEGPSFSQESSLGKRQNLRAAKSLQVERKKKSHNTR